MSSKQTQKPFCKVCCDAGKSVAEYNSHYVRDRPGGIVVCPTILKQNCNYCKKPGHTPSCCPELEGKYNKQHAQAKQQQPQGQEQAKQQAQGQAQSKHELQARAREICASPPPMKRKNYFNSLSQFIETEEDSEAKRMADEAKRMADEAKRMADEAKRIADEAKRMAVLNNNFPSISAKINRGDGGKIIRPATPSSLNGWSTIASKPKQSEQQKPEPKPKQEQQEPKPKQEQQEPKPKQEQQEPKQEQKPEQAKQQKQQQPTFVGMSWADY